MRMKGSLTRLRVEEKANIQGGIEKTEVVVFRTDLLNNNTKAILIQIIESFTKKIINSMQRSYLKKQVPTNLSFTYLRTLR